MAKLNPPPEYLVWATMKTRCKNKAHPSYAKYGAMGVSVCDRWENFDAFLADMGPRPEGYTLERKDSRGNYEPGNCRWATRIDQNNNRCSNVIVEYRGKKMAFGLALQESGTSLPYSVVKTRLRKGWDLEKAFSTPRITGEDLRQRQSRAAKLGNAERAKHRTTAQD